MLNDETFRQLIHDRRHEREREAQAERLAAQARRARRRASRTPTAGLALLLAARRHAIQ